MAGIAPEMSLAVFVATRVTEPDVIAFGSEQKRQVAVFIDVADPHFG